MQSLTYRLNLNKIQKNNLKLFVLIAILFLNFYVFASNPQALNHPSIRYDGVFYPIITENKVVFNRHLQSMKSDWESGIAGEWINQWVISQTGIKIRFKTSSPTIQLTFEKREGGGAIGNSPTNGFSVFVKGNEIQKFSSLNFTIQHPQPGNPEIFEVSLPNLWAVNFTRLELEDGYELENLSDLNLPIYVSIGNSITHGTGQYVSSAKTYPFILAQKSNWNLHNLAVAGATLGWAIAKNIKNQKVDVITILLGFNDWKYTTSPLQNKKLEYEKLLDSLRHYQPNAKIYCITPLFSTDKNGSAPYSLQEFRDMVTELVNAKQQNDKNLCLINGPSISDASMLASGDPVHLSESGANKLAQNLFTEIENCNLTSIFPVKPALQNCIEIEKLNSTEIHFKSTCTGNHTITLVSLEGKIIYQESIDVSSSNLKVFNMDKNLLKSGFYILIISNNISQKTVKIIVE